MLFICDQCIGIPKKKITADIDVEIFKNDIIDSISQVILKNVTKTIKEEIPNTVPVSDVVTKVEKMEQKLTDIGGAIQERHQKESKPGGEFGIRMMFVPESDKPNNNDKMIDDKNYALKVLNVLGEKDHRVVGDVFRVGKEFEGRKTPRKLIVRLNNAWSYRKIMSSLHQMRNSEVKHVSVGRELSNKEIAEEKRLLQQRYKMINTDGIDKKRIKIRNLKLLLDGKEIQS